MRFSVLSAAVRLCITYKKETRKTKQNNQTILLELLLSSAHQTERPSFNLQFYLKKIKVQKKVFASFLKKANDPEKYI